MHTVSIRRVSVWLDSLAPERGAFAHAVDWASHLEVPLRIFLAVSDARPAGAATPGNGDVAATIHACAAVCDYSRVELDATSWCGPVALGAGEFLQASDLSVFGSTLPPHEMEALLQGCFDNPAAPLLVCPPTWQPVMRPLILNQARGTGDRFLEAAADMCLQFQARPVVLTVAHSAAPAEEAQLCAERAVASRGLSGDYDSAVGYRVRSAVTWAAHWHKCSHVFVGRRAASPLWRWLRGDTVERLLGLTDTLALLAVPDQPVRAAWPAGAGAVQGCASTKGVATYPPTTL